MSKSKSFAPTRNFAFELLRKRVEADGSKNVLVSPLSVSVALAMTMNGARGSTEAGIAQTLGLPAGALPADRNDSFKTLIDALDPEVLGVELAIANAIWAKQGIKFNQQFLDDNAKFFKAKVETADFSAQGTVDAINDWVETSTKKRIDKLVDSIDPQTIMFLLNAVYFKGSWTSKFDKDLTSEQPFTTGDGSTINVPTMKQTGKMRYFEGDNYQGVALPFGESKRINLYVLLPNESVSASKLLAGFGSKDFTNLSAQSWESEGTLLLPRFQVEYDAELKDSLADLGMADAFSSATADLSGIAKGALYISKVKHKTFAKFDEEGGEAAAVTSVEIGLESVVIPWTLAVNRPFLAILADDETETVLFAGLVNNPSA